MRSLRKKTRKLQKGGSKEKYIIKHYPDIISLVETEEGTRSDFYNDFKDDITPLQAFATFIDVANELATTEKHTNVNKYEAYLCRILHFCYITMGKTYIDKLISVVPKWETIIKPSKSVVTINGRRENHSIPPLNPFRVIHFQEERWEEHSNTGTDVHIPETDVYEERKDLYSDLTIFIKTNKKDFRHLYKAFFGKAYEVEDSDRNTNISTSKFKEELVATALAPERIGKLIKKHGKKGLEI